MKIAVVIDNDGAISRHFGRAPFYLVFTVTEGKIVEKERCDKPSHQNFAHEHHEQRAHDQGHGLDANSADKHTQMLEPVRDCEAVIVRGMGTGAYLSIERAHIRPFVTHIDDAEAAVHAYLAGTLVDHPEKLH